MLRTAAFTQSSLYPHMLLHREVCAQRNFTHRRIYTERFYAKRLLHSEAHSSAEPALLPFELLCIFLLPLPDHLPSVFPFPSPLYHSRLAAPHRCQNSSGFTRSSVSYHAIIPWQSLASSIAFVSLVLSSLRHLAFYFCVQISCQVSFHCCSLFHNILVFVIAVDEEPCIS